MIIDLHCMVKNEAILLEHVLPIWKTYPIRNYIFYNDSSTDNTEGIIYAVLGSRARVITSDRKEFNEAANRQDMLNQSMDADYVLSIDSDELLTANFWDHRDLVFNQKNDVEYRVYCYNLAGSWTHRRTDPAYKSNYLCMTARPKDVALNLDRAQYHTQRRLPSRASRIKNIDVIGNIHLQSLNLGFYALKQLWYKHWEYHNYHKSVDKINAQYDRVVHRLKWPCKPLAIELIEDLYVDPTVFDRLAEAKGYKQYILNNLVPKLVTFGHKYLDA